MKRVNTKRKAERDRRCFDGPDGRHAEMIRGMLCACWSPYAIDSRRCRGRTVAAHVVPRKMGSWDGCWADIVNLCDEHHRQAGEAKTSQRAAFEATYRIDLRRLSDDLAAERLGAVLRSWRAGVDVDPTDWRALNGWLGRMSFLGREAVAEMLGVGVEMLP